MDLSLIIPTRNRPLHLHALLARLEAQTLAPKRFEVLVGFDGPDPAGAEVCWESPLENLRAFECPRSGIAAVKNELIAVARGRLLLFLNDDVLPEPGLLEAHLTAQRRQGCCEMILGDSPWKRPEPGDGASWTQFDELIASTSMIFFYDRMRCDFDPLRNWGFRHAWNLNLSVPRDAVLAAGGFRPAIANCCYEDIELAYRLSERGLRVMFRPEARAEHDHRYTPQEYLARERRLGYSAYGFAAAAPDAAAAVFGRDIASEDELEYGRAFIEHEARREPDLLEAFEGFARRPAEAWPGREWIDVAFQQHLLLKRLAFYRGLLTAARGERMGDLFSVADGIETRPGLYGQAGARRAA